MSQDGRIEALRTAILETDGRLPAEQRRAALDVGFRWAGTADGDPEAQLDPSLAPYLEKVARHAYKVTPEDLEDLAARGHSDDALFEATIATAVGAGLGRLAVGLRALEEAEHAA